MGRVSLGEGALGVGKGDARGGVGGVCVCVVGGGGGCSYFIGEFYCCCLLFL